MDPRWGLRRPPTHTHRVRPVGPVGSPLGGLPLPTPPPRPPPPCSLSSSFPLVGFSSCGGKPEYGGLLGPVTQCPHPNTQGHCLTGKELASWL